MNKMRQGQDMQDQQQSCQQDMQDKKRSADAAGKIEDFEVTGSILKCCFDVMKELGSGFLESVYKNALSVALQEEGLAIELERPFEVLYKQQKVGFFLADLIVEKTVIIELKCTSALLPEHLAQTINYLKATNIPFGLLVNFGNRKLEYRRLFHPNYQTT
jgi:GxxExxY protein